MTGLFFPLGEYWWLYATFTGAVLFMLLLDLGVFHRDAHAVSFREAAAWSIVWICLSLAFGASLYFYTEWKFSNVPPPWAGADFSATAAATQIALEFLTGFLVEKSLSVDNIFVFVVVFSFFAVPPIYQHRILFYGILGALLFRAIFIALGSVLLHYEWLVMVFGGFLILTGVKIVFAPEKKIDPSKNPLIRLLTRYFPVTHSMEGGRFVVRKANRLMVTPLLLALVFVEFSDIIFAVDSVPAIFAITKEPFIVFTSNVCAILGLRAMYFLLAGVVDKFHFLKYGLGLVLVFVGLKMVWLNEAFGGKFPVTWSLAIITVVIGTSVALSLAFPKTVND